VVARTRAAEPATPPADLALAARLMGEAARLWAMAGRADVAHPWAVDALAAAERSGDRRARLYALGGLAVSTVFAGRAGADGAGVQAMFEQAIALAEETGEWWLLAIAAGFSGATIGRLDPEAGEALLERGVEAAYRSGSPYSIAAVSIAQGRALGRLGRTDAAVAAFDAAIRGFIELGDQRFVLAARSDMAHALRQGGRLDAALDVYRETIGGWVHLGHKGAVASQLENVGYLEVERGDVELAVRLLAAAERLRSDAHASRAFDEEPEQAAYVERAREALGASFDTVWREGYSLSQAAAVSLVTATGAAQAPEALASG
jgi:tetratricopeptide (TPR) repeat protein